MSTEPEGVTDAPEEPVLSRAEGSILVLTLNRPERLNAVSLPMYQRLLEELRAAADDRGVRCVVLTGQGRAFCVGADLKSHGEGPPTGDDRRRYVQAAQQVNRSLQLGSVPVVAAVNGHAIGAGLEMALSSDFMVVARKAKLRFPEVSLGTFVGGGTVYTLAERVGVLKARELIYLGDFFSGEEAAEMGVAYRAVSTEDVLPTAMELARRLTEKSPISLSYAKRLIGPASTMSRHRALRLEGKALERIFGTRDWQEGVEAFKENRPPHFTGDFVPRTGHPLDPIFLPRSVAVIGASGDERKRGHQILRALQESEYAGSVYAVNPRGGEVLGQTAHTSIDELPEVPDLAIICTPAATVPDVVARCGRRGVRGVVVLAVGFRESGEEGAELERATLEAAREHGVRVVGPNTSGILNLPLGLNLIGARGVRPGSLSLLVQSGNMALALMNEVTARSHEGISICVGVGNELDLSFHEYLDFLAHHDETRAVVCYVEGFKDARAFLRVAAGVARIKPILLIKGARSELGQAAARSHTGAVAGEYDRLSAGLRQANVVEVTRADELVHLAQTLAGQPPVRGSAGIAILADGGGQGTLAADTLSDFGVPLTELSTPTRDALRELLGDAASVSNPVDVAGAADADPRILGQAVEVLAEDEGVGGVLVVGLFGGYAIRFAEELAAGEETAAAMMVAAMNGARKPFVVHSMYAADWSPPLEALSDAHVPVIQSLDVACRCISETWLRGQMLARPSWTPDEAVQGAVPDQGRWLGTLETREAIERARSEGREALTEPEARALLRDVGVPFPPTTLCHTAEEVAQSVAGMDMAMALKVVSAKIPHKSDAGGVALGIDSPEEGAAMFRKIEERAAAYLEERGLPPGIDGVLVSPMLASPLAELLIGARRDPDVGPVLTLGAGGIWVEVLKDVSHRVLPVDDREIRSMLAELRTHGLLAGARRRKPGDIDAVVATAQAVARLILENADVAEVEVNPLFVYERGVEAVDARVFLEEEATQ